MHNAKDGIQLMIKIEIMKALEDRPLTLKEICDELNLTQLRIKPILDELIANGDITYFTADRNRKLYLLDL
jgi:DNA-binding MarR family transcriptional regulator